MPESPLQPGPRRTARPAVGRCRIPAAMIACAAPIGAALHAEPLASQSPRIPEPLVFDLVRPLGARAGEREINVLATRPWGGGPAEWAPEIEYAYADGQSLEIELPFEDGRLTRYKVALQGTFGIGAGGRWIHGWQTIGEYDRERATARNTVLYVSGYRFDARWSLLSMAGLRHVGLRRPGATALLLNYSLFYDADPATVLGLELNLSQDLARGDATRALIIPQVHRRLTEVTSIQAGFGLALEAGGPGLVAALRLIRDF